MIIHQAGKKNSQLYLRNLEQKLVFSQISTHSLGPRVDDTDVTPSKKSSLATRNPNEVTNEVARTLYQERAVSAPEHFVTHSFPTSMRISQLLIYYI